MPGQLLHRDASCRGHASPIKLSILAVALAMASPTALGIQANAGTDQTLPDTDQQAGEVVTLRGSGSVPPIDIHIPPGHLPDAGQCRIWIPGVPPGRQLPPVPCLQIGPLPLGAIVLGNTVVSYRWLDANREVATTATASVRLPDGQHALTLVVTDATGASATDIVNVRVNAGANDDDDDDDDDGDDGDDDDGDDDGPGGGPGSPGGPGGGPSSLRADAGADRNIADTDGVPGEDVVLDGGRSGNSGGPIASYQWLRAGQPIATGTQASVRLADGSNLITLLIFDDRGNSAAASVRIFVGRAEDVTTLSQLPSLTPNQRSLGRGLDELCPRLRDAEATLLDDQRDLLARCRGLRDSSADEQTAALDEIAPDELNSISTQTFDLSRLQLINVTDRLIALRAGAEGFNLTGLNLESEHGIVPLDTLVAGVRGMLGGGASADRPDDRSMADLGIGVWMRGNYGTGSKDAGAADRGFRMDGWGVMGGIDYRVAPTKIIGLAVGYGQAEATFNPIGSGNLDTRAATGALYATMYNERGFYFDAIASYLQADYDSVRRMFFTERSSLLDLVARGTTGGATTSAAMSIGLDQHFHGFTLASSFGAHYIHATIDAFREHGAGGLDLAYDEQDYATAGVSAGLRLSYTWKTDIGTLIPQIRGEYIHELSDSAEQFDVKFANDPFEDTASIVIEGEVPDRSYWRLAAGLSAQLRHGIAAFIEYQQLQSNLHIDYTDVLMGLRFESSFE